MLPVNKANNNTSRIACIQTQIFIRRNREHPGKKYEDPRTSKGHTRLVEGKKR